MPGRPKFYPSLLPLMRRRRFLGDGVDVSKV
ncbi:hypothetical protein AVEN_22566-1, partial [Araneus ventricosus]